MKEKEVALSFDPNISLQTKGEAMLQKFMANLKYSEESLSALESKIEQS
ncbi:hypothetical protein [Tengunoibacter tsumagoiensis]|nr:hypothetical protein [Tengunoibacter tsumagoiensis]